MKVNRNAISDNNRPTRKKKALITSEYWVQHTVSAVRVTSIQQIDIRISRWPVMSLKSQLTTTCRVTVYLLEVSKRCSVSGLNWANSFYFKFLGMV